MKNKEVWISPYKQICDTDYVTIKFPLNDDGI